MSVWHCIKCGDEKNDWDDKKYTVDDKDYCHSCHKELPDKILRPNIDMVKCIDKIMGLENICSNCAMMTDPTACNSFRHVEKLTAISKSGDEVTCNGGD